MPAHKHCELFLLVSRKLGLQRSGTVSWVLRVSLDAQHLLSPLIRLGIRHPRKKGKKLRVTVQKNSR